MNKDDKLELVQMIDEVVTKRITESESNIDTVMTKRIAESEQRILEDMKQFTTATVSQQTADIRGDIARLDNKIDTGLEKVNQRIDDLANSMAKAIDDSNDAVDEQVQDHEVRITKLEQKAA